MTMRPDDDERLLDYATADRRSKRDFGQILQIGMGYLLGLFMLGIGVTELLRLGAGSDIEQVFVVILIIAGSLAVLWYAPAIVRWQHRED